MTLQRTCTTAFFAFALITAQAAAAPYVPPVGTGWWQLQSTDGQYTDVCAESNGPCNPPDGTYTLIDFATDPATRMLVTIKAQGGTESGSVPKAPRLVVSAVSGVGTRGDSGVTQGSVGCDVGEVIVGGSCSARSLAGQGRIIPTFGGVSQDDPSRYTCETSEPAYVIRSEATCF